VLDAASICLLDNSSKILSSVLVARMGELMKRTGMESQGIGEQLAVCLLLILDFLSARNMGLGHGLCSLTS